MALAEQQKALLEEKGSLSRPLSFFEALDLEPALAAIPEFLVWLERLAPAPLVEAASEMRRLDQSTWRERMLAYLTHNPLSPGTGERVRGSVSRDEIAEFVVEAVLQPFAEAAAIAQRDATNSLSPGAPAAAAEHAGRGPQRGSRAGVLGARQREWGPPPLVSSRASYGAQPAEACAASEGWWGPTSNEKSGEGVRGMGGQEARCPICGDRPVVGVLREEGQSARRMLVCGLCLTEWEYLRILCPGCAEQHFDALPVYIAEEFPHIRIEACESCRYYLKTVDLTKNGLAVPLVDDIASLALDLWAREQGYVRLRPNLLRM